MGLDSLRFDAVLIGAKTLEEGPWPVSVELVRNGRLPFLIVPTALPTKKDSNFARAPLSRGEEYVEEAQLCCRIYGRVLTVGDMLPGAGHELAGIGYASSRRIFAISQ